MTHQRADVLINRSSINFGRLEVRAVVRGTSSDTWKSSERVLLPDPKRTDFRVSNLHRGFVREFVLESDGRLIYSAAVRPEPPAPLSPDPCTWTRLAIGYTLTGDFFLEMSQRFDRPSTFVPFVDGKTAIEHGDWIREPPRRRDKRGKPSLAARVGAEVRCIRCGQICSAYAAGAPCGSCGRELYVLEDWPIAR